MNIPEAIEAGLFVQFVYGSWNSSGQTTNLDGAEVVSGPNTPVIAGKSYKVLKTIYSNDLATDISPNRPLVEGYKTIGIVAVDRANPQSLVIAVRGTEGIWEWLQDIKFLQIPFANVAGAGLTEDGFTDMYYSFSFTPGNSNTFVKDLLAMIPSGSTVTVVGHSLGSALSTLLALDISAHSSLNVISYTYASPRVGDLTFQTLFNHIVPNTYRIDNRLDIVPKTPPPLFYYHVGDDTELIPPVTVKFDLACEHNTATYFNMLATLLGRGDAYPIPAGCLM